MKTSLILSFAAIAGLTHVSALAANVPPLVTCPAATTVLCNTAVTLTAQVSDADGDALTVTWSVNGAAALTNTLAATNTLTATNVSFTAVLPFGTNTIGVSVVDTAGNTMSCSTTVNVLDVIPPVITAVTANPKVLWPPNHKLVTIRVHADVTDDCTPTTWKIISVSSNEAADAKGSGHTAVDWQITGDHTAKVRAERSGKGSGRIYTITVQAADAAGNLSLPASVTVSVPHDKGKGNGHGKK